MKIFKLFSPALAGLLILCLVGSCEKNQELQITGDSELQFRQGADLGEVIQFMARNNMGNGAIFLDPGSSTTLKMSVIALRGAVR